MWALSTGIFNIIKTYNVCNEISETNNILFNNFYLPQLMFYDWDSFENNRFYYNEPSFINYNFNSNNLTFDQIIFFKYCFADNIIPRSCLKLYSPGSNLFISFYKYNNIFETKRFSRLPDDFWNQSILSYLPTPKYPLDFWWIDQQDFFTDYYSNKNYVHYLNEKDKTNINNIFFKKKIELFLMNFSVFIPIVSILFLK